MKLSKIVNLSKDTKQTLMGGIVGALTVQLESGLSWFVADYPQILKDKLSPMLPRNGALVANVAPVGVAYAMTRKHASARANNLRNGLFFYDIPKLIDQVVYNVAYQAGVPQVGMRLRSTALPINIRNNLRANSNVMRAAPVTAGKYAVKSSMQPARTAGLGKYALA